MAERATLNQVVQVGVEATPGAGSAPTRRFQTLGIEPSPSVDVQQFRPAGSKYRALTALIKEWTTAQLQGTGSYTEIIYPLSSLIDTATVTTPGGATAARLWTFESDTYSDDSPKTFAVQHGSSVRADSFNYGLVTEFGMTWNRNSGVEVSGQMMGRRITDGVTLASTAGRTVTDGATTNADATVTSATAAFTSADVGAAISGTGIPAGATIVSINSGTSVEISANATATATGVTITIGAISSVLLKPILATQVSVYIDDTFGGLGGTKMLRAVNAEWNLSNRYGPVWVLDAAQSSYVNHIETEPDLTMSLMLEADSQGMDLLDRLREGDSQYIRVEAVGETDGIESGQAYTFTLDFAGQVVSTNGFSDQDGLYAIEWTFVGVHDASWGKAFSVRVKNALTGL